METQLPALLVIAPLIAAPLCVAARKGRFALPLALAAAWITAGVAIALLLRVLQDGTVSYPLGGWAAPWGIEYRVDLLGAFVAVLVAGMGAITITYSPASLSDEIREDRQHLFLAAFFLCLAGLLGIAVSGDLFNVFVFLEVSALASYVLISLGRDRRAVRAAFQYLVMGTIGATFILIGIGLLYMMTGTLNMADMAVRVAPVSGTRTVIAAFGFITIGLFLKMALFPLHLWLPNAYTYAPSVITAFLAATATKVSVYVLVRFSFSVLGTDFVFEEMPFRVVVLPLAVIGVFVASAVAIFQHDVKRLLAYSSVANVGYMVLGISLTSVSGLTAGIVHLLNHAITKGGLFLAMGCLMYRLGSTRLEDLRGIGRRMPFTMAAWVAGGLGLIGVPLTAGFITKWYLIQATLELRMWSVAMLILISSLLALVYVWRVVEIAYFREPEEDRHAVGEAPLSMLLVTWVVIGASLWFGVSTTWSGDIARSAANALLGATP